MTCYESWLNWNYWTVTSWAWPSQVYKDGSMWESIVFCCEHFAFNSAAKTSKKNAGHSYGAVYYGKHYHSKLSLVWPQPLCTDLVKLLISRELHVGLCKKKDKDQWGFFFRYSLAKFRGVKQRRHFTKHSYCNLVAVTKWVKYSVAC